MTIIITPFDAFSAGDLMMVSVLRYLAEPLPGAIFHSSPFVSSVTT